MLASVIATFHEMPPPILQNISFLHFCKNRKCGIHHCAKFPIFCASYVLPCKNLVYFQLEQHFCLSIQRDSNGDAHIRLRVYRVMGSSLLYCQILIHTEHKNGQRENPSIDHHPRAYLEAYEQYDLHIVTFRTELLRSTIKRCIIKSTE